MKTIFTFMFVLFTLFGSSVFAGGGSELIKGIMDAAGVNEEQAKGGAGALLEMAKGKMDKTDFDKVSDAVPNMGDLLSSVPAVGGGKTSMPDLAAKQPVGMPKVLAVFDKLGISRDKVQLFTPIIVNYVEKKGGKAVSSLLEKAFQK